MLNIDSFYISSGLNKYNHASMLSDMFCIIEWSIEMPKENRDNIIELQMNHR